MDELRKAKIIIEDIMKNKPAVDCGETIIDFINAFRGLNIPSYAKEWVGYKRKQKGMVFLLNEYMLKNKIPVVDSQTGDVALLVNKNMFHVGIIVQEKYKKMFFHCQMGVSAKGKYEKGEYKYEPFKRVLERMQLVEICRFNVGYIKSLGDVDYKKILKRENDIYAAGIEAIGAFILDSAATTVITFGLSPISGFTTAVGALTVGGLTAGYLLGGGFGGGAGGFATSRRVQGNTSISATPNPFREGAPIALLFGTTQFVFDASSFHYTRYNEDGDQYIYGLFNAGFGDLQSEQLKIGADDADIYRNAAWLNVNGTPLSSTSTLALGTTRRFTESTSTEHANWNYVTAGDDSGWEEDPEEADIGNIFIQESRPIRHIRFSTPRNVRVIYRGEDITHNPTSYTYNSSTISGHPETYNTTTVQASSGSRNYEFTYEGNDDPVSFGLRIYYYREGNHTLSIEYTIDAGADGTDIEENTFIQRGLDLNNETPNPNGDPKRIILRSEDALGMFVNLNANLWGFDGSSGNYTEDTASIRIDWKWARETPEDPWREITEFHQVLDGQGENIIDSGYNDINADDRDFTFGYISQAGGDAISFTSDDTRGFRRTLHFIFNDPDGETPTVDDDIEFRVQRIGEKSDTLGARDDVIIDNFVLYFEETGYIENQNVFAFAARADEHLQGRIEALNAVVHQKIPLLDKNDNWTEENYVYDPEIIGDRNASIEKLVDTEIAALIEGDDDFDNAYDNDNYTLTNNGDISVSDGVATFTGGSQYLEFEANSNTWDFDNTDNVTCLIFDAKRDANDTGERTIISATDTIDTDAGDVLKYSADSATTLLSYTPEGQSTGTLTLPDPVEKGDEKERFMRYLFAINEEGKIKYGIYDDEEKKFRTSDWLDSDNGVSNTVIRIGNDPTTNPNNGFIGEVKNIKVIQGKNNILDDLVINRVRTDLSYGVYRGCSNPAAIFRWFCLGQKDSNGYLQWGVGFTEDQLENDDFVEWYKYCQDNNLEFNALLDGRITVQDTLGAIAATGRASTTFTTGKLGVHIIQKETPTTTIDDSHIIADSFSFTNNVNRNLEGIRLTWNDENNNYQEAIIEESFPDINIVGERADIPSLGLTNQDQAEHFARETANRLFYQNFTFQWHMPASQVNISRGDVIFLKTHLFLNGEPVKVRIQELRYRLFGDSEYRIECTAINEPDTIYEYGFDE